MSGMAEVLREHELAIDYPEYWACTCGTIRLAAQGSHPEHIVEALSAAGFGDVREQKARLDAVSSILDEWASHKAFPDAEESQQWYSLGKRHAADAIRAALTATVAAS